jgi:hypothetical protein
MQPMQDTGQQNIVRMYLNFKVLNDSNTIKRTKEAYHQLVQSLLHLQLDLQKMLQLHQQLVLDAWTGGSSLVVGSWPDQRGKGRQLSWRREGAAAAWRGRGQRWRELHQGGWSEDPQSRGWEEEEQSTAISCWAENERRGGRQLLDGVLGNGQHIANPGGPN